MSKILVLDIETKPAIAYSFNAYDVNLSSDHIIEPGGTICFAAKWAGKKGVMFYSDWTHDHKEMLRAARNLLDEADAVVTYHGDGFDLPRLKGEFVLHGLKPNGPVTSIDVLKTVKKFGFMINKLAFVGPLLGVGKKLKHEGFSLWVKVMNGDPKAQQRMQKYNIQDVMLLEKLYERVKPFMQDHPHLGDDKGACSNCNSDHLQLRGYRRTKYFKVQRMQCQSCGSWSTGIRTKIV